MQDYQINSDNNIAEYLFHEGTNYKSYNYLGAHIIGNDCVFRVWAPSAKKLFVTGDFCNWNYYQYEAFRITQGGIFECVITGVKELQCYKYVIITNDDREILKSDPYGFYFEVRPNNASVIYNIDGYKWNDDNFIKSRTQNMELPMNIYEVHFGSWKKDEIGDSYSYDRLSEELIPYIKEMGYTHIEILPISEHPYDPSWGYQVTGYYAPTSRYGKPKDFMRFIDICHQNDIGVILDWVPAHFPKDAHGLYEFDGTRLYEYQDENMCEHPHWGTRIFDFGRNEVISFLISNATFWLDYYHIDGIRVDAVSSIIYLNYGREDSYWRPNVEGGNINIEAVNFLKQMNKWVFSQFNNPIMIAEEATTYKGVTSLVDYGGLGFSYKWNMGFMNDTLDYMKINPYFKSAAHNNLTFSITYGYTENFVLPLSHDEVVHGKCSLISKMPGYYVDKFANLRAYLAYMFAHPGKKLTFMGTEIGQFIEWDEKRGLDFFLLEYESHKAHLKFTKNLNLIYKKTTPLFELDNRYDGFKWLSCDDRNNNIIAFERVDTKGNRLVCVSNFSSQDIMEYCIKTNDKGIYKIIFNTDDISYGGNDRLKDEDILKSTDEAHSQLVLHLPPFSSIYLYKEFQNKNNTKTKVKKGVKK